MPLPFSRRRFLQTAAAGAAASFLYVPRSAFGANDRVDVACIGVSNQGAYDLLHVASSGIANIVALCDIDQDRLDSAAQAHPSARKFSDYRKMFDAMEREIDAIVVAVPDHHHAFATLAGLRRGKHVYCEKPLTHDPHECRTVIETAAKAKVATQMGTQIHAQSNYRRVVEIIQAGTIGAVNRVHVWVSGTYTGNETPKEPPKSIDRLNWEMWVGPAPYHDYNNTLHPFYWRGYWNYGTGMLGDMACHHMDLSHWALGLMHPQTIEADGPSPSADNGPAWLKVHYHYPARSHQPPVHLTWYHGGRLPEEFVDHKLPAWSAGSLFVGDKGMLLADYNRYKLFPETDFKDFQPPPQTIPESIGHHKEWLRACQSGSPTLCNFAYSGPLAETVLLGNVAHRSGKKLEWDEASKKLKNISDPDVGRYFSREYRKGWEL